MNTAKIELRATLRRKRMEMSDAERTLKSRSIVLNLKDVVDWSQVSSVHYFEPLTQLMEPDINEFTNYLQDNFPKLKLSSPRFINGDWEMVSAGSEDIPGLFEVVLVPFLGFDNQLNRIGYGGGYYDRLLATQPDAKKIGVGFELSKVESIPAEPQDIPLDLVVTEAGTYLVSF